MQFQFLVRAALEQEVILACARNHLSVFNGMGLPEAQIVSFAKRLGPACESTNARRREAA
jgi:hypothetical protein